MTRYFVAKIWLYDLEEFQTTDTIAHVFERTMEETKRKCEGVWAEKIKVEEVELKKYEKED